MPNQAIVTQTPEEEMLYNLTLDIVKRDCWDRTVLLDDGRLIELPKNSGYTLEEVADILGLTTGGASCIVHKAVKKMKLFADRQFNQELFA